MAVSFGFLSIRAPIIIIWDFEEKRWKGEKEGVKCMFVGLTYWNEKNIHAHTH